MIARMWHGEVPSTKAEAYHEYLNETGLKDYGAIPGNKGVYLLTKQVADSTHFYTLTFWDGWQAIKEFAGADYEKARYYPADKDFLVECEPLVEHFDVLEVKCG
jgi:heme-degrading monooxygenase HmoA